MKRYLLVGVGVAIIVVVVRIGIRSSSQSERSPGAGAEQTAPRAERETVTTSPATPDDAAPVPVPTGSVAAPRKSVLQRIAESDASVFKLTAEQIDAHLESNQTNAESLVAAFNVSGSKEYLREALGRYPGDAFVLVSVLANDAAPEKRREMLEQLKQAMGDNPLANYWLARDYMKEKQPDMALKEFAEAATKSGFHDFSVERIQGLEEMYLGAGYGAAEAKALAMASVQIPAMAQLRQLGKDMAGIGKQYLAAGDAASAEMLARMGLTMAGNLKSAGANSLLGQMVGTIVEREFVSGLDPNGSYEFVGQPISARLTALDEEEKAIRNSAKFYDDWVRTASEAQLVSYFDRLKLYGESAALEWARRQPVELP